MAEKYIPWEEKEWDDLWEDTLILYNSLIENKQAEHFIGAIVTRSEENILGGIQKYSITDGQQRLTTISLIIVALRDMARERGNAQLAEKLEVDYLLNKSFKGTEIYFKMNLTEQDKVTFQKLVLGEEIEEKDQSSQVYPAYLFFISKLEENEDKLDLSKLSNCIGGIKLIILNLGAVENANRIFETLNFRGKPLTRSDLIRNYFMMSIGGQEAEDCYKKVLGCLWRLD